MHKFAVVRRKNQGGNVQEAAVNVALVRYVYSSGSGSYIAFEDEHAPDSAGIAPIGIKSPDSVEDVIRRLNRPYWFDVSIRAVSLIVAAFGVFLAIKLS